MLVISFLEDALLVLKTNLEHRANDILVEDPKQISYA